MNISSQSIQKSPIPRTGTIAEKTDIFKQNAKLIHGDLYDYEKTIYENTSSPIIITCNVHGDYKQRPNDHLNGKGCKLCGFTRRSIAHQYTTNNFIKIALSKHDNFYSYESVEYINSQSKVSITCKLHGTFNQRPNDHLSGKGCPECKRMTLSKQNSINHTEFIIRAKNRHGDAYDYSATNYTNSTKKVEIICPMHGIFTQRPSDHISGKGCPACINKTEGAFKNLINEYLPSVDCFQEYRLSNIFESGKTDLLRYDFYFPLLKLAIELDGIQHYQPIEFWGGESQYKTIRERDLLKNDFSCTHSIDLIRISYKDFNIKHSIQVRNDFFVETILPKFTKTSQQKYRLGESKNL